LHIAKVVPCFRLIAAAVFVVSMIGACKTSSSTGGSELREAVANNTQPYLIVSDIDDTVKITDVPHVLDKIGNGLFGDQVFAGMRELYSELLRESTQPTNPSLIFLSGSPPLLKDELEEMLIGTQHFPEAEFHCQPLLYPGGIHQYKMDELQIIARSRPDQFILLGDDTQWDPESHSTFAQSPAGNGRVIASYIHVVLGRPLPTGVVPYHTAFDVALMEMAAGRLTSDQATSVGSAVLSQMQQDPSLLFPAYVKCPTDLAYASSSGDSPDLVTLKDNVASAITAYCKAHSSDSNFKKATEDLGHFLKDWWGSDRD
jgi:hypothetical protein